MSNKTRKHHSRRHNKTKGYMRKSRVYLEKGLSSIKTTSRKYMPKVKSGLENVGAKVTDSASKSIPVMQKKARQFLGMIGINKPQSRRNKQVSFLII
jgi:hypothetical protein